MSGGVFSIKLDEYRPELEPRRSPTPSSSQVRKSDRACDFCRRRKTRCDGAPTQTSKCSNCKKNQCPCTYLEASRPRGPPKAYVTALEDRVERFERLLKRLRPEADLTDILGPPIPRGSWKHDQEWEAGTSSRRQTASTSQLSQLSAGQSVYMPSHGALLASKMNERERESGRSSDDDSYSSDGEMIADDWPRRCLPLRGKSQVSASDADSPAGSGDSPMNDASSSPSRSVFTNIGEEGSARFHGKSSLFPLIQATRHYMRAAGGDDGFHEPGEDSEELWSEARRTGISNIPKGRRRMFWTYAPWEEAWERKRSPFASGSSSPPSAVQQKQPSPLFAFPPSALVLPLLSLYFHHTNPIFPLLHGPTFYAQFHDGLHLRDPQFAGVVWAVLAVASRWSDDRRVLWDGWGSEKSEDLPDVKVPGEDIEWASAGWRFFLRSLDGPSFTVTSLDPPSLFDLQFCSLGAMFLRGSSLNPAGWVVIGTGLRKAMDVGAHRKKVYGSEPSVENELWKRAFWMLVLFDRFGSAGLGRPCCVREEDFDLDLPLEVDDEYWIPSDPSQPAFRQPPGKPSIVSGFNCILKLTQIKAHALRTIYCIDKSKVLLGLASNNWQEQIVSQLNTALDEWVESVPEHLHWSSDIENDIFSNQSATIYTSYYLALILIYRPFSQASALIPQPNEDVPARPSKNFPFPADSICTSAAHSAIRIVDAQTRRGLSNIPNMVSVAHIAAVTQLMSMHASQAMAGAREVDPAVKARECERYLEDVQTCIRCLELAESRWIMARKFLNMIKSSLPESGPGSGSVSKESSSEPYGFRQASKSNELPGGASARVGSGLPSVPSQTWTPSPTSTRPPSQMSDAERALKNHANWRWFHENEKYAQRFSGMQKTDSLRHHVVIPSSQTRVDLNELRSNASPASLAQNVRPLMRHPAPARAGGFAPPGHPHIGRRFSIHSNTPPPSSAPPAVPEQPISSISRTARATTSGQFLSVTAPQSAARDELGGWNASARQHQQEQAAGVRVPSHPYATLSRTSRQVYRQTAEHQ